MSEKALPDFDDKKVLAAILVCGTIAIITFLVLPLYVGLLADNFGFSSSQLGILASMDLAGIAVMSLSSPLWIKRLNWRVVVRLSLLWLMAWNFASMLFSDFATLCLVRFMAGLGGGLIAAMVMQSISYVSDPDRVTAIYVILQISLQSLGFVLLPSLIIEFGLAGFFGSLIFLGFLALFLTPYFPVSGLPDRHAGIADGGGRALSENLKPMLVLLGMVFFFIAQVSIFSFAERLGVEAGFSPQDIGDRLGVAALVGLGGAILGAIFSTRFGRCLPIVVAALAELAAFALWSPQIDLFTFTVLLSVINFFWNMPLGYHIGVLISEDRHHRFILFVPFVQALGISAGPLLGGFALEMAGYGGLVILASSSLVLYTLLLASMAIRQDRAGYVITSDTEPAAD